MGQRWKPHPKYLLLLRSAATSPTSLLWFGCCCYSKIFRVLVRVSQNARHGCSSLHVPQHTTLLAKPTNQLRFFHHLTHRLPGTYIFPCFKTSPFAPRPYSRWPRLDHHEVDHSLLGAPVRSFPHVYPANAGQGGADGGGEVPLARRQPTQVRAPTKNGSGWRGGRLRCRGHETRKCVNQVRQHHRLGHESSDQFELYFCRRR